MTTAPDQTQSNQQQEILAQARQEEVQVYISTLLERTTLLNAEIRIRDTMIADLQNKLNAKDPSPVEA